jgi:hypothetical protein
MKNLVYYTRQEKRIVVKKKLSLFLLSLAMILGMSSIIHAEDYSDSLYFHISIALTFTFIWIFFVSKDSYEGSVREELTLSRRGFVFYILTFLSIYTMPWAPHFWSWIFN